MNRREFIKSLGIVPVSLFVSFDFDSIKSFDNNKKLDDSIVNQWNELEEIYSIIYKIYKDKYIPSDNIKFNKTCSYKILNLFCDYLKNDFKYKHKDDIKDLMWISTDNDNNEAYILIVNNPRIKTYIYSGTWNEESYIHIPIKTLKYNGIVIKFNHKVHRLEVYKINMTDVPDLDDWWNSKPIKYTDKFGLECSFLFIEDINYNQDLCKY